MAHTYRRRVAPSDPAATAGDAPFEHFERREFARRLHAARTKKGWSQSDLAREIWGDTTSSAGYTVAKNRDRISQYEAGKSFPSPESLAALAQALEVEIEELAPSIARDTMEHEDPAIAMTMVSGHPDKVHLRINTLVPFPVASRIISLLSEDL